VRREKHGVPARRSELRRRLAMPQAESSA